MTPPNNRMQRIREANLTACLKKRPLDGPCKTRALPVSPTPTWQSFLVCDPTTSLYDRIYALRGERVEAIWPIVARRESVR